jgi:hypothetical protein
MGRPKQATAYLGIARPPRYFAFYREEFETMGRISRSYYLSSAIVVRCGLAAAGFGWFWISSPATAIELTAAQEALYTTVSIFAPSATSMTVCYGFVCRRREIMNFTPADRAALSKILGAGHSSGAAERAAVQKAMIWFDRRIGPIIGTDKRVANADIRTFDDKHNFDCWDTTRNTTSLLLVLQQRGLLKHHVVGNPGYRGYVINLQLPHNTAVLIDRATRTEWVVDMWTRGYAQPPDVKPLAEWIKEN